MKESTKEDLLNEIKQALFDSVENLSWSSATYVNAVLTGMSSGKGIIELSDASRVQLGSTRPPLTMLFSKLRKVMASPETGVWYTAMAIIKKSGEFDVDFNYGDQDPKPIWDQLAPWFSNPPNGIGGDSDAYEKALIADYKAFPFSKESLPDWHPAKNSTNSTNDSVRAFIESSVEAMKKVQEFNVNTWHLNSSDSQWGVDTETGKITFTFSDKVVSADVQIIGTLHNGEFMWGWDHPSVPEPLSRAAALAKDWGNENIQNDYTEKLVAADIDKAWEFTAVAARLDKASGTYSGATGDARVFMTFGPFTMQKR